ncbi:hypothetical protein BV25DRAFT_1178347 [Artomyces pyxidatus]|uniref:Uncharacterized protein n=1 Tax=Artomyces pyxidatus TaxID=48021 RepID=A0ACB8SR49_9AGAM|nr:hypothetical protein BV25DRAFT_1178347 [Artomyces pyxidatus]
MYIRVCRFSLFLIHEQTTPPTTQPTATLTYIHTIVNSGISVPASTTPSATASVAASGGTSTGAIVGGAAAAVLGLVGVVVAVIYFLKKSRHVEEEDTSEEVWNRDGARRQSAVLSDEPAPVRSFDNGFGGSAPRPPTMIERHLNSGPATLSRQPTMPNMYGTNAYGYNNNGYNDDGYAGNHQSFSPGEYMATPTSTNPFISQYAQSPMGSPTSATVPNYHNDAYGEPSPPPHAVTRQPSTLSRHNTVMSDTGAPAMDGEDPHYVDLSRSSVTPFQAAQYVEISRKLGTQPPSSLGALPEEDSLAVPGTALTTDFPTTADSGKTMYAAQAGLAQHLSLPAPTESANPESPFADPAMHHDATFDDSQELEFPAPPAALTAQHSRIPSTPPVLPEIHLQQRAFSPVASDFPVPSSVHASPSPFSTNFGDVRAPPPAAVLNRSSPLASPPATPRPHAEEPQAKRPDTVFSLYDEEDAYGGI